MPKALSSGEALAHPLQKTFTKEQYKMVADQKKCADLITFQ